MLLKVSLTFNFCWDKGYGTKGFRHGVSYDSQTGKMSYKLQGWQSAVDQYNGGGASKYGQDHKSSVINMYNN